MTARVLVMGDPRAVREFLRRLNMHAARKAAAPPSQVPAPVPPSKEEGQKAALERGAPALLLSWSNTSSKQY